jgi:hypothetical protein
VAHAWSVADLFSAVPVAGDEVAGIPAAPELTHAVLARARGDAAVRLELSADHQEALVGVRLDGEAGVDRLDVVTRLDRYLATDARRALLRVDVSEARHPAPTRALGRGLLAADAWERVLRICARSGRNLDDAQIATVDRVTRQAASLPIATPRRLKEEIAVEVGRFLEQVALAERQAAPPRTADRQRLVDDLAAGGAEVPVAEISASLAQVYGRRVSPAALRARAVELRARLGRVWRQHAARINEREMLFGADLPTEGVLSEEVRDATREAMGPIVGLPVAAGVPGARPVQAVPVGGAPSDRALSQAWPPRLRLGLGGAAMVAALLLGAIGGLRALAWWPLALAPAALLVLVPVVGAVPVGLPYLAVLAGALAGGMAFAVAYAPGRRDG